ncbi:MAG: dephospho-CoA kinase [Vampirovibrionia bacterium]
MENKNKVYKIGITGGIACGKSVVRRILDGLNVPTIDADEIVHDLLQFDKEVIAKIVDIFGDEITNEDGGINRKELAKIVFPFPDKLKQLEAIIHPYTFIRINEFLDHSEKTVAAVVIPLLFETNRQKLFDSVWLITAEEYQQIERLKLRDNMSEDEAKQRIASQMPQNTKKALADVILDNSGPIENIQKQVEDKLVEIKLLQNNS